MADMKTKAAWAHAKLGISLAWSGMDSHAIADCLELPGLDALAIPSEALPNATLKSYLEKRPEAQLHAGRIIDQAVSQNILYAPKGMRDSFSRQVASLLAAAEERGFSSASLDLGLESALDDAHLRSSAIAMIRSLAPILLKGELKLLLPCRAPSLGKASYPALLADFIKDCMTPRVKMSLELHPHELLPDFQPSAHVRGAEFDIALATLMFNADAGNRLVKAHIEPWISYLAPYGFKGPFLLCPKSGERSRLPTECEALARLISTIRKKAIGAVS
jgi:hypothetical protein